MLKWDECLFLEGQDEILDHFSQNKSILIVGLGFDPRTCRIADVMLKANLIQSIYALNYNDVGVHHDTQKGNQYEENKNTLMEMCIEYGINMIQIDVPMYKMDGLKKTLVIYESIRNKVGLTLLEGFDNILVDVSAMPKGVSFSLIKHLLAIKKATQKISIIVCENSRYDDKIIPVISEESAEYLPGFDTFSLMMEQDEPEVVWFPVLGMEDSHALRIIGSFLQPIEICPVVPFPSVDIRREEKMLRACGEVLFRESNVGKRDIIYVPENDPRFVCQKLYNTVEYYERAFSNTTKRKIQYVFSSSSSKLIDIGVLLAILNLKEESISTGIVIVEKQGYLKIEEYKTDNEKLYCLCLDEKIFEW